MGLAGGECPPLGLVSYGYEREIWVWVHVRGRLTLASPQPSLCLEDVDDHQLWRVARITKSLLRSTRGTVINELAVLINISFRDASSGGFLCSIGEIELVYRPKLGCS